MKFLNNKGWGIATEIVFIFFFICCLLYAIYYINKMGLLNGSISPFDNNNDGVVVDENKKYKDLEQELKTYARIYVNKEYDGNLESNLIVTVSKLQYYNYIDSITDPDDKEDYCTGYVEVEQIANTLNYTPYLNCSKYQTEGYVRRKDI